MLSCWGRERETETERQRQTDRLKREILYLTVHCHHRMSLAGVRSSHEQDSVHPRNPYLSKRKEGRSGLNPDLSVYQPNALPLGQTGSPENGGEKERKEMPFLRPVNHDGYVRGEK